MNTRKLLINALASGDIEAIRKLKRKNQPTIYLFHQKEGKNFLLSMNTDIEGEREISLTEIEELRKDNNLIVIEVVHSKDEPEIAHSEKEVQERDKIE